MLTLKRRNILPQLVTTKHPKSHTEQRDSVFLMGSRGSKRAASKEKRKGTNTNIIHINTYNIRSIRIDEKLYELEEELTKIK